MRNQRTNQIPGQRAIDLDTIPGQLDIDDATPAFDPNVCIGFEGAEHAFPVEQLGTDWLCPECSARLDRKVARMVPPKLPTTPPCGHTSYNPNCLACYGD